MDNDYLAHILDLGLEMVTNEVAAVITPQEYFSVVDAHQLPLVCRDLDTRKLLHDLQRQTRE